MAIVQRRSADVRKGTLAGAGGNIEAVIRIEQVSVHPARQGVGAALIEAAARWAQQKAFDAMTLMTFRDVPWNRPYYERLGFRVVDEAQLTEGLRALQANEPCWGSTDGHGSLRDAPSTPRCHVDRLPPIRYLPGNDDDGSQCPSVCACATVAVV